MTNAHDDDAANDDGVVSLESAAFGRYFRKLRKARGLSPEEFSELSGLSVATIRRIESGHSPGLDSLRKTAKGLNVPLSTLFNEFEDMDATAVREISLLLRGRHPNLVSLATQMVRMLVDEWSTSDETTSAGS